jgi:hypothetical protein
MSQHKRTIRTLSHCFYDFKYHLDWTPKYRGKVLNTKLIQRNTIVRVYEVLERPKQMRLDGGKDDEIVSLPIRSIRFHDDE